MTTNSPRPCRALAPSACPYHGALIRMDEALAVNNVSEYMAAKSDFDKAAADKLTILPSELPVIPENTSYDYSGKTMTNEDGIVLYQIRATRDIPFADIKVGDLGGWVDPAPLPNGKLRISGNAWVYGNAQVIGNAQISGHAAVYGNAKVSGNAQVAGNALIRGNARVSGHVIVSGEAQVYANAQVWGRAKISNKAEVFGRSSIFGHAHIIDNAKVYDKAKVSGEAWIMENSEVYAHAEVTGSAVISGFAQIDSDRKIDFDTHVGLGLGDDMI